MGMEMPGWFDLKYVNPEKHHPVYVVEAVIAKAYTVFLT